MKKQKQLWGKAAVFSFKTKEGIPIRVIIQVPYEWERTHDGEAVRKYWASRRRRLR
jgi:hypothetical protein